MSTTTIPRFLLPQRSALWKVNNRRIISPKSNIFHQTRNASTTPHKKPPTNKSILLEKPTKFNPPSHGSRLKNPNARPERTYGAPLSAAEREAQSKKQYPNMLPPEGTFLHWFLTNRSIHVWITLSTLLSLAGYTTITHFRATSPVADMLPPASDLFYHPIRFCRQVAEVYRLHVETAAAKTYDHRVQKVLDVGKRSEYRKAHGMASKEGTFGGWEARTDAETLGPGILVGDGIAPQPGQIVRANWKDGDKAAEEVKRKSPKWFGIW